MASLGRLAVGFLVVAAALVGGVVYLLQRPASGIPASADAELIRSWKLTETRAVWPAGMPPQVIVRARPQWHGYGQRILSVHDSADQTLLHVVLPDTSIHIHYAFPLPWTPLDVISFDPPPGTTIPLSFDVRVNGTEAHAERLDVTYAIGDDSSYPALSSVNPALFKEITSQVSLEWRLDDRAALLIDTPGSARERVGMGFKIRVRLQGRLIAQAECYRHEHQAGDPSQNPVELSGEIERLIEAIHLNDPTLSVLIEGDRVLASRDLTSRFYWDGRLDVPAANIRVSTESR